MKADCCVLHFIDEFRVGGAQTHLVTMLREALRAWTTIEQRSRRGGDRWFRARRARLQLLIRLNRRTDAVKLLRLTRTLYPNSNMPDVDAAPDEQDHR